ncbi:plasmid pRiA4b ORF-3 family protein [Cupriavidus basilensis]|uniref:plasmid pRiA4b ORF-3 family protein n=1 Tax=Cupriavidus basilensis TaxID=68895 RepID=UPI00157B1CE1|nr:plasmid pRiA4b ORF-3 family protein [Cupriavidus basilensis]NUA31298.1 plasmid pRiA4b ORF-3 family protein [Cupriavidus basilensis]
MSVDPQPAVSVLPLRISLRGLSPPVWRWVLVAEYLTLAQLHNVIQVVMGWTDEHLHQFSIRGRRYGEAHEDVLQFSTVANALTLTAFGLREHEGFVYVYDFNAWWLHDIRVERRMLRQRPGRPCCVAGCGPCPPEDIGGLERYLETRDERSEYEFLDWLESLREGTIVLDELRDEVDQWLVRLVRLVWLDRRFDRRTANDRLQEILA